MLKSDEAPTLEDLRTHRAEILRIAAEHGAHNVRAFGSVAGGYARPDSDIDLLVDFDPERTVLDLSSLILDLQDVLGRKVDVVEAREPSSVRDLILRTAVPL